MLVYMCPCSEHLRMSRYTHGKRRNRDTVVEKIVSRFAQEKHIQQIQMPVDDAIVINDRLIKSPPISFGLNMLMSQKSYSPVSAKSKNLSDTGSRSNGGSYRSRWWSELASLVQWQEQLSVLAAILQ